jgi:Dr1-associated corepressor
MCVSTCWSYPCTRKHAIETTEMLDFLKELVEGVPDPSAGGSISLDTQGEGEPTTSSRRKGKKAATNVNAADDGDEDGSRAPPTKRRRRRKKEEAREADNGPVDGDRDEPMPDVAPPSRRDENWDDENEG